MDLAPDGPRKLQGKGLVTIPLEFLDALGWSVGDQVWVAINPDKPGTLVVLPRSVMTQVFEKGWTSAGS